VKLATPPAKAFDVVLLGEREETERSTPRRRLTNALRDTPASGSASGGHPYCGVLPVHLSDTAAEADAVRFERYARMTAAEKAARVVDLTRTACSMALAGLRRRHPAATQPELLLRLAALRLGAETVWRAYGWRAPDGP
jgi:DNA invertase Pin-like site-specific DNA recombinase